MTDKTDLEKNLDSAIEKVGNDMYSFVSKPLLIECRDVLIENQSLTSRIEGLEKSNAELIDCIDHLCDDIKMNCRAMMNSDSYGEASGLLSNHNTGGGDNG